MVVGLSCGVTGLMSLIFHAEIRLTMMLTGLVCAVVVDAVVSRITRKYRVALRRAKRELEDRVAERTADLRAANTRLTSEAAERVALQQHLVASDRMATAGTMAAAISHEIRNPLMAIICNLEFARGLEKGFADERLAEEAIDGALEGAAQVQRIAVDLATLANPNDDELEAVDVCQALSASSRLATHNLKGASLEIDVADAALVIGCAPRLVQVFLNLITNAAQATDESRHNSITVRSRILKDRLEVTVADTGRGIAEDKLASVFRPFFTTRKDSGGTGLGLSICRTIVESCGGTLDLESEVGVGTTFRLSFITAGTPAKRTQTGRQFALRATAH